MRFTKIFLFLTLLFTCLLSFGHTTQAEDKTMTENDLYEFLPAENILLSNTYESKPTVTTTGFYNAYRIDVDINGKPTDYTTVFNKMSLRKRMYAAYMPVCFTESSGLAPWYDELESNYGGTWINDSNASITIKYHGVGTYQNQKIDVIMSFKNFTYAKRYKNFDMVYFATGLTPFHGIFFENTIDFSNTITFQYQDGTLLPIDAEHPIQLAFNSLNFSVKDNTSEYVGLPKGINTYRIEKNNIKFREASDYNIWFATSADFPDHNQANPDFYKNSVIGEFTTNPITVVMGSQNYTAWMPFSAKVFGVPAPTKTNPAITKTVTNDTGDDLDGQSVTTGDSVAWQVKFKVESLDKMLLKYRSLVVTDQLDSNLALNGEPVVKNSTGGTVPKAHYSYDTSKGSLTFNETGLANLDYKGGYYSITYPTTVKASAVNQTIKNKAKIHYNNVASGQFESNEVSVEVDDAGGTGGGDTGGVNDGNIFLRDKDTNKLLTVGEFKAAETSVTGKAYSYETSQTHTGRTYDFSTIKGVADLKAVTNTYHSAEAAYYTGGYDYYGWYDDDNKYHVESFWNDYLYYHPAVSANPDIKVTVTQTKAPENYYLLDGQQPQTTQPFSNGAEQEAQLTFYNYRKADLNVQRIEIDTDQASTGLPVRIYLNKKATSTDADQQKFTLNLYNQTTNQKVYTWGEIKIGDLPLGTATKAFTGTIPTSDLSVNQKQTYEARIESFNADKVQLKNGKIDTEGYTAVEKAYTATIDTNGNQTGDSQGASFTFTGQQAIFKGIVQTSREQGYPIQRDYETIAWSYTKIPNTKSGYGFERKLTTNYVIEGSRAKANFDYAYDLVFDQDLVKKDTYVPYTAVGSQAKLPLDATTKTINTTAVHQVAEFPKVQSEKMTGAIFTDEQVAANDSRITTGKTEGFRAAGRKLYTPIWAKIRSYDVDYQSTKAMGVHAINVRLKDNVNVYAQLWVTMDSVTQKYDELMIIPVFPDQYVPPASWPTSATTWLRDTIKQDSDWHGTKYVLNDEGKWEKE